MFIRNDGAHPPPPPLSYTAFVQDVTSGQVKSVTQKGQTITGEFQNNKGPFATTAPANDGSLAQLLVNHNVDYRPQLPDGDSNFSLIGILISMAPLLSACGHLDILHAPDAGWRRQGDGLWQIAREAAHRTHRPRDI